MTHTISNHDIQLLVKDEVQLIIRNNENTPVDKLVLKLNGSKLPVHLIADQIKCRKKALKKFPTYSTKKLIYESTAFEQSSSEATAILKSRLMNGKRLIDLTGGLGIDTVTLSNNFNHVVYSEMNPNLVELFRYNSALFETQNIEINYGDSIEYLKKYMDKIFDWIYLDPARRDAGRRSVDLEYCSPNVYEHLDLLKEKSDNICIKVSPAFDFTEAERKLPGLADYIVVSVNNECKEVLLLIKKKPQTLTKHAVLLDEFGNILHEFSIPTDKTYERNIVAKPCKYFYEPDTAIIKSGLTNYIADKYQLSAINQSADFLTSNSFINDFPGRTFEAIEVLDYKPNKLNKYFAEQGIYKANIAKREFPKSVDEIRKELKLKEGGDDYLFLTKDSGGRAIIILTTKIQN